MIYIYSLRSSTFVGDLMAKPSLLKKISVNFLCIAGNKGVHTLPKGISLNENISARV